MSIFRTLFLGIDHIIYGVIAVMFNLIMNLANFELFRGKTIEIFSNRIYLILGIVMIFKLIISFIQILINPDNMVDKEKGLGGILKRVIISLILIVMVPTIFQTAKELQKYVVPLIPKVILATKVDVNPDDLAKSGNNKNDITDTEEFTTSAGELMAYYSFLPFFYYADESCANGKLRGTTDDSSTVTITKVADITAKDVNETGKCPQSSDGYTYVYRYLMSTIAGFYLMYTLIMIAKQTATRAIKLGLCQIIAPIPIATYIDPKLSKQSFDNWVNTTIKVYTSLFANVASVYFVLYVFVLIFNDGVGGITGSIWKDTIGKYGFLNGSLLVWFVISALLHFAKEMPKFISGMLGIKEDFGDISAIFKGAGGMFSANVGSRLASVGNFMNAKRQGQSTITALKSAAAGRASGLYRGSRAALNGKGPKEVWNTSTQGTWQRRNQRAAENASGVGFGDRMSVAVQDYFKFNDDISLAEGIQKSIGNYQSADKEFKATANDKMTKRASDISFAGAKTGTSKTLKNIQNIIDKNDIDAIKKSGNQALIDLVYAATRGNGRKTNGQYLTLADLGAAQAAANQLGLGKLSYQLSSQGDVFLAAQKEIQNDLRSGTAIDAHGATSALNQDTGVTRALSKLKQINHQDFGNVYDKELFDNFQGGTWTDKSGKLHEHGIQNEEELMLAYEVLPSEVDDMLNRRAEKIADAISNSKTAAARQFNEQRKSQNNSEK